MAGGGGHNKLIFSALQRCYSFLGFLFSRLFSSFRLFTLRDSSWGFKDYRLFGGRPNNLNPALALWDSCLNAEKNVGGLAVTYNTVISYLNKILRDKIDLTHRKSAHLAVICGRLFSAFRHSSSSFLTRLFYHYYFTIRAAMSLGGIGSAYGSSLASLSLNQSKNINKINNNESKNTDIQGLLEGLCFAAC